LVDTPEPSEAELVLRSQTGDRAAFERLVRRSARGVYARLYLDVGRADRAEDLSQETFLVAWRSIRQLTDPDGFRPWLLSIAKTVAIDAARREGRKKRSAGGSRVDGDVLGSIPDERAIEPADGMAREEARQRVLTLLRSLPEEYRLPLMLRYLQGSDYQTISRELGLTNGSLRGLLNRGMAILREKAAQAGLNFNER
jgi:RNA polymerase sigma-70 factor (ECF subfamily)